jgi:hypothetical protein
MTGLGCVWAVASQSPAQLGQVRELTVLCLRFEALASSRVFRLRLEGSDCVADLSLETLSDEDVVEPSIMHGDLSVFFPPMNDNTSDLKDHDATRFTFLAA